MEILSINTVQNKLQDQYTLRGVEQPILIRQKEERILISHPQWHLSLSMPEFKSLFQDLHFVVVEQEDGIDEEKDEDYYAWRNKYL